VKAIVAGIACLALGVGAGRLLSRSQAEPIVVETKQARATVPPVRERVVVVERQQAAAPIADDVDRDSTPDDAQAERAQLIIDRAATRGVWTEADREALHAQFAGLSGETKAQIFATMSDAVNRGVLRIEAESPL